MTRFSLTAMLLAMLLFSCDKGYLTDCSECHPGSDYPVELKIFFWHPIYEPYNPVITLYEGNVADSIVIATFYPAANNRGPITFNAILYKDYSATMRLFSGQTGYLTVASAHPKVRYVESLCDSPCYYVYNNLLDLRLRYN